MNDLEMECFDLAEDILTNRPRNPRGNTVKYNNSDRLIIINLLRTKINIVKENRNKLSPDCYTLLIKIYTCILKFVEDKIV